VCSSDLAFCEMARASYEYVIIDAPPIGAVADFDLIQLAVDGVVMVLRPDHTRRGGCSKAFESIPKEKMLGVLLNATKAWPFGSNGYGYGYGYGGYHAVPEESSRKSRKAK
jgi:Mrp family chromosome partitioning ATPase